MKFEGVGPTAMTQTVTTASMSRSAGSTRRARASQNSPSRYAAVGQSCEQQVGDQVAAEREEHTDAEQAATGPAEAQVVDDHGYDGDSPQAVETRHVALVARDGLRHATPDWAAEAVASARRTGVR